MSKLIIPKDDLERIIVKGVQKIAGIVKRTLGPGGLPILIERQGQQLNGEALGPKITKDGVSVADECFDLDADLDLVIQTVKAICKKTVQTAGDGTTTAIVLGEAILLEAFEMLKENPELNPQLVRESIEEVSKEIQELLKKEALPVTDEKVKDSEGNEFNKQIYQVAKISANGDEVIGNRIARAFEVAGTEGVINVDEGSSLETTIDKVEGYQIARGSAAGDRFFNSKDGTQYVAENVHVLIYDGKLLNYTDLRAALLTIQNKYKNKMPPVLVVANEFSNEVIQFLLIQKIEAGLPFCAVKGPHTTSVRSGYYQDMAVKLGGEVLGQGSKNLNNVEMSDVGMAKKVVVDKYVTTFYDCAGEESEVLKHVEKLRSMKKKAESAYDAQVINDRASALTEGIVNIGVGGHTDLEIKERYDRMEDALNASRAALETGILPGGGVALYRASETLSEDSRPGARVMRKALKTPLLQILLNIGVKEIPEITTKLMKEDYFMVYDARIKKILSAYEAGVIDPVKVTASALENATSIAALLCTAGGGIVVVRRKT